MINKKSLKINRYAGMWVAFIGQHIVAFAKTLPELEKLVGKLKLRKKPVYFLVPRKDEGPFAWTGQLLFAFRY